MVRRKKGELNISVLNDCVSSYFFCLFQKNTLLAQKENQVPSDSNLEQGQRSSSKRPYDNSSPSGFPNTPRKGQASPPKRPNSLPLAQQQLAVSSQRSPSEVISPTRFDGQGSHDRSGQTQSQRRLVPQSSQNLSNDQSPAQDQPESEESLRKPNR